MKKTAILVMLVAAFAIGSAAAAEGPGGLTGVGVYAAINEIGSGTGDLGTGLGLSLKFGYFPVIGLEWSFRDDASRIAGSVDYWVGHELMGDTMVWYHVAIGGYAGVLMGDNAELDLGLRLPLGLEIWPVRKFELFLDIIPLVGFLPEIDLGLGADFGLRVHF